VNCDRANFSNARQEDTLGKSSREESRAELTSHCWISLNLRSFCIADGEPLRAWPIVNPQSNGTAKRWFAIEGKVASRSPWALGGGARPSDTAALPCGRADAQSGLPTLLSMDRVYECLALDADFGT